MAEHFQIITKKSLPKVNEVTFYDHFTALYSEPYVLAPFQAPSVEFLAEFLSSKYSISKGIYLTESIINLYHSLLKKILSHNPKWVHNPQWLFQKQVTTLLQIPLAGIMLKMSRPQDHTNTHIKAYDLHFKTLKSNHLR